MACALLSGSQALSEILVAHPQWIERLLDPHWVSSPRSPQAYRKEVSASLQPCLHQHDFAGAFRHLRLFKQREILRIAARDLARLSELSEVTAELSGLADSCLEGVFQVCWHQLTSRSGVPYHQDPEGNWQPTAFCVLGMGKLGGQELNYSSDVDVLFVYTEEGTVAKKRPRKGVSGAKGVPSHHFFKRLSESFIAEVSRLAPEGTLYRIDLRLRPEGNAGPLARSLPSYENYYAQWGQTWERMMLIKARCVAGDASLAGEFLESVHSFRYPRSLSDQALGEMAAMKQRIENEIIRAGEIDRNVKLGRGGIREVEFVTQTLQILNAGKAPFLSDSQTVSTLERLVRYELLEPSVARQLTRAYGFLREVEHRLQMENNLQTHTIPLNPEAQERLARLMGFPGCKEFDKQLTAHRRAVRKVYESILQIKSTSSASGLPPSFDGCEAAWKELLERHSFRDPAQGLRMASVFIDGPGFGHVAPKTVQFSRELFSRLLSMCPRIDQPLPPASESPDGDPESRLLSDPDRVLTRMDSFIAAYGARGMMFETWATNPSLFDLLVLLFDRSEFLAETAIRTPDLVDELEQSGRLRRPKQAEETLRDLRHGLADADQKLWIRQYHQAEFMRIGLREILGLADFEQNLVELSALAEACLQYALEVVLKKHKLEGAPMTIVGLGKLGGSELNYGSDLDIVFVTDTKVKNLPRLQQVAVDVLDLLSDSTESGTVFATDARLRPNGEKGLLVNTLKAYEDYYANRAQLWELQSLSRSRPVAGDSQVGAAFMDLVVRLTAVGTPLAAKALQRPDWMAEIARMRLRIEKERTPAGQQPIAIKTGTGGLMDAEFVAQALCLANGWQEPNTLKALCRARDQGVLAAKEADVLIENYRKLRRIEGVLRRWSYMGETTLPEDPAPLYRVARRCGFNSAESFMSAVNRYRENLRKVYVSVFRA